MGRLLNRILGIGPPSVWVAAQASHEYDRAWLLAEWNRGNVHPRVTGRSGRPDRGHVARDLELIAWNRV